MKIGLISINMYSKGLNFACPLHNWAFQEFLRKKGIQSTIIDYLPNYYDNFDLRHPADFYEKKVIFWQNKYEAAVKSNDTDAMALAKRKIEEHTQNKESFARLRKEREIRYDKFQKFIDERYVKTEERYDAALLEARDPGFDCYICVTDAIWKKEPYFGYEPGFFLAGKCMENKWKIAYAASTYFTENPEDARLTRNWIRDIDFVSVRESFLQERLEKHVRPDVTHVVDPVLLHDAKVYEKMLVKPKEKKYLLLYYVMNKNPEMIKHALDYAKANDLTIVELSDQPMESTLVQESGVKVVYRYDVGIEEWLGYIKYASCVFTNSFHASCFSILFKKVFFAERRKYDKVGALLDMVGLSDFLIDSQNFAQYTPPKVDWSAVKEKLSVKRAASETFILDAIRYASKNPRPVREYLEEKKKQTFPFFYNIGKPERSLEKNVSSRYNETLGKMFLRPRSIEFLPTKERETNDGTGKFHPNVFKIEGMHFVGWRLRLNISARRFYLLENGSLVETKEYNAKTHGPCKLFKEKEPIPVLPYTDIKNCVAEAQWEKGEEPYEEICADLQDMKIGLISINMYSKGLNFACPLHNWAFQKFLADNGIESTIIDYIPNYYDNFNLREPAEYYQKKVQDWERKRNVAVEEGKQKDIVLAENKIKEHSRLRDGYQAFSAERASRHDKFRAFIESRYIKTAKQYDSALLEVKDPGFDCYICVTDAIWKKEPYYGYEPGFFLASSCMDNKRKIAYAASTYFTENEQDEALTQAWIRDIDYVFVREEFMKKAIQETIREDVNQVVDPVLLHEPAVYEEFLVKPKEENYLLLYYVMSQNPDVVEQALQYAKANDLTIVELSDQANENERLKNSGVNVVCKYDISIEEWLGYLKYAVCAFTNSFHASCFCTLFETPFFAERRTYDKVGALLDMVGLSDQIISVQDFSQTGIPKIDWAKVRRNLAAKRKESQLLILGAIYAAKRNPHKAANYVEQRKQQEFPMFYNIGRKAKSLQDNLSEDYTESMGKIFVRPNSLELLPTVSKIKNDGSSLFHTCVFKIDGFKFVGWHLRVKIENRNFLMLENGNFIERTEYKREEHGLFKLFQVGEPIPVLNKNCIKNCVAEAVWKPEQ